jgi:hypothetical protein
MTDGKADAVDRAKLFGLDRWLAAEQFAERSGRALAGIFLDQLFDEKQRRCNLVTPGLDPGVHRT